MDCHGLAGLAMTGSLRHAEVTAPSRQALPCPAAGGGAGIRGTPSTYNLQSHVIGEVVAAKVSADSACGEADGYVPIRR